MDIHDSRELGRKRLHLSRQSCRARRLHSVFLRKRHKGKEGTRRSTKQEASKSQSGQIRVCVVVLLSRLFSLFLCQHILIICCCCVHACVCGLKKPVITSFRTQTKTHDPTVANRCEARAALAPASPPVPHRRSDHPHQTPSLASRANQHSGERWFAAKRSYANTVDDESDGEYEPALRAGDHAAAAAEVVQGPVWPQGDV